jgi:uncharacterized protein (TIGR01777 family)
MNVAVLGASGFIGKHLVQALRDRGDSIVTASLRDVAGAAAAAARCDAIVNLAGEPIAQRWTAPVKRLIADSRTELPKQFLAALAQHGHRVKAYVSASAIGYYGTSESATFVEESPPGDDFLAHVCAAWEAQARGAEEFGMRVTIVRTGVVLGRDGGALAKMLPAFRAGVGGIVGSGRQWISWVHVDDLVGIFMMALDGPGGVLNATAPNPVTNAELTQTLAAVLHRPAVVPVPAVALRLMLGEAAGVLLTGQRVLPRRTLELGYRFAFPELRPALEHLLANRA